MTMTIDETHDPALRSWVDSANGHADFPIQNLPLGVFSVGDGGPRGGVAIGDQRLAFADPELLRAASAVLALPQNQPLAAKLLWETADVIWSGLGDSSRDVNWYSKRATLSAVYAASVLYWLGDTSEGRKDTRDFIDRRIDGVMQFEKFKASARKIPGVSMLTDLALGWVRAPKSTDEKEKA